VKNKAKQGPITTNPRTIVKILFILRFIINEYIVENAPAKIPIQNSPNAKYKAISTPKGKIGVIFIKSLVYFFL